MGKYLVKHYSGCFCEGVFLGKINIYISGLGQSWLFSIAQVGLIQSVQDPPLSTQHPPDWPAAFELGRQLSLDLQQVVSLCT